MRKLQRATATFLLVIATGSLARCADLVRIIRVPQHGAYPQAQVDPAGRLHLIYFTGDPRHGDIDYVISDDDGENFGKPLRVNSRPQSALIIGTVRGPQLALGKNACPHVAWMGVQPEGPAGSSMLYTHLNEAGDAFEPQRNLAGSHPGLDGGGSIAADAQGRVYVAWHAPLPAHDTPSEADRRAWVRRSLDDGRSFEPERPALSQPTGACGCCGMKIFADASGGRVLILFRTARERVNRDMYLLASSDQAQTFSVVATDPWRIGKCVMSTASFAASKDATYAAWETMEQLVLSVFPASAAEPKSRLQLPATGERPKHPALAVDARGRCLAVWTEGTSFDQGGTIAWQVFDRDLKPVPAGAGRAPGLPANSLPSAFVAKDGSFRIVY
jgi:hypothetical protein